MIVSFEWCVSMSSNQFVGSLLECYSTSFGSVQASITVIGALDSADKQVVVGSEVVYEVETNKLRLWVTTFQEVELKLVSYLEIDVVVNVASVFQVSD